MLVFVVAGSAKRAASVGGWLGLILPRFPTFFSGSAKSSLLKRRTYGMRRLWRDLISERWAGAPLYAYYISSAFILVGEVGFFLLC